MNRYVKLIFLTSVTLTVGCKYPFESNHNNHVTAQFYLADSTGQEEINFYIGQDIYFHYSIINHTGKIQNYAIKHSGPFASFEVFQNDSLIGTSDDGLYYIQVIIERKLSSGDTLQSVYSWYTNKYHSILPAGEYFARAKPNLWIDDIYPSSYSEKINFVIME